MTSNFKNLTFLVVALASVGALAQPANDLCANAQVIPSTAFPVLSSTVTLQGSARENAFSCQSNSQASVWYAFTPAADGVYTFQTCTPAGNTVSDTIIALYTGTCASVTEVACSDDFCSNKSSVTRALTGGTTYLVQVGKWSSAGSASDVIQLQVERTPPTLNDSCNSTIPDLQLNQPAAGVLGVATNDSQTNGNACFTGTGQGTSSSTNTAPGRDAVYRFTPPTSGAYSVRFKPLASVDSVLYLSDSCVAAMTPPQTYAPPQCIAGSNRATSDSVANEELSCVSLTAGVPYFVWADEGSLGTAGVPFELEVNGCVAEVEPNNTPATANTLACPTTGNIGVAGEADFFALGTATAGARVFALVDGVAGGNAGSYSSDFDLRVTNLTDTLEYDDANADTPFGSISALTTGTPLTAGQPNFLRVSYFSASSVVGPYRLYQAVQNAPATAETEPNDTLVAANAAAGNYFSGNVSAIADTDLFAINARAGDLLFIALDGAASRTATTADLNLALLDSTGTVLVNSADSSTSVSTTSGAGSLTSTTPNSVGEALVYRVRNTGNYFARVTRTSSTGTSDYLLSITFDCQPTFGPPTFTGLTPNTGSVVGNTSVTLDGTNFGAGTSVYFGTTRVPVVSFTATQLTVNTPVGVAGPIDVSVVNPGSAPVVLTQAFTYFEPVIPPTVSTVTPAIGPTAGGTNVTIDGTIFKAGAEVRFTVGGNTVQATNVVVVNAVRLTCTTPAQLAGLATVTVRNPVDALEGSLPNAFEFVLPPTLTAVAPDNGLVGGGYTATLTGTTFRTGAQVRFGTTLGTGVVVDPSGNSLTVVVPASATNGQVNVSVTNIDGQVATLTNGFRYTYPAPSIANIGPASGFSSGGTTLTINGNNFLTGATVTVGGAACTNVVFVSATRLTCTTPAGTGTGDVVVTNTDTQSATLAAAFTYVPAPVVTGINPNHGPVQGGTLVTLTGTGFVPGASVNIGGVPAFAVTVTSATTATAITNGAAAGVADITVTNPDTQRGTLAMAYTFDPAPMLLSVSPVTGTTAGGTRVTLTGTGFLAGTTVLFGTDPAPMVTVVSSTEITAEAPVHAAGVVSITVRNTDNQFAELARAFRFVDPPTLTAVAPNTGDVAGGTLISLTGTGFAPGSTVTLDGVAASGVAYVSSTELTAYTPAHGPGMVDVVVTSDGVAATLTYGFTYTRGAPALNSVAPVSGPVEGGTLLTLTGSGFADGATIKVGGVDATDVVVVSPVLARAVVPAHAAGTVDVVLKNDDMQSATLSAGFTYVTAPSGNTGTISDGGSGALGTEPVGGGGGAGGVSCGCSAFDGSTFALAGLTLLFARARRRKR